jgi:hypothetical protein
VQPQPESQAAETFGKSQSQNKVAALASGQKQESYA